MFAYRFSALHFHMLLARLHFTYFRFRFRCWVKCWGKNVIKKLRCSPRGDVYDAEMMPFDAEMDIDGRGRSNGK